MPTLLKIFLLPVLVLAGCATNSPRPFRHTPHKTEISLQCDDHGNPLGCSWYCGAPPIEVTATSSLRDGIYSYDPGNAHDSKKATVWVEGADGVGVGERIIFSFDMTDQKREPNNELGIDSVSIINGFARSQKLWQANGRAKELKIFFDGKYISTLHLKNSLNPERFDLPRIAFHPGKIHEVAFEITKVYPGTDHEDTVIADFFFSGFGTH